MTPSHYFAVFVVEHLYYIPQFEPIARELKQRNLSVLMLLQAKDSAAELEIARQFCRQNQLDFVDITEVPNELSCDFLVNGANYFPNVPVRYRFSALVVHGIGTKAGYYTAEMNKHDVRFVEGETRLAKIKELWPDSVAKLYNVGFAKLDAVLAMQHTEKAKDLEARGLDPKKKTLLYAPTFYPSSIEKMPLDFPKDFADYNILIKPHFFSLSFKKYAHQRKRFAKWQQYSNVYVAQAHEFNLVPFLALADVMLSDESSAIFEFAALNKPVVCNRNVHFRWTYRVFKRKIRKRMDANMDAFRGVAELVYNYADIRKAVEYAVAEPMANATERLRICREIVGEADGMVSVRIANIMQDLMAEG